MWRKRRGFIKEHWSKEKRRFIEVSRGENRVDREKWRKEGRGVLNETGEGRKEKRGFIMEFEVKKRGL